MMRAIERLKRWAGGVKAEVYALYLAYRDPRVPWYARLVALCVVAYAFSPVDLIPDPIPVLGYLDDLILVPLGIALAIKLIPAPVLAEHRRKAREQLAGGSLPIGRVAAAAVVAARAALAALAVFLIARWW